MRILVTGGAGFIGSHVVDALIAAGHDVIVVDNLAAGKRENVNPAAKFYRLDICSPELADVLRAEKIDVVNHHAAQIDVRRSVAAPGEDARINIQGLLNILENGLRYGVRGVVFASSGGVVYGEPEALPVAEDYPKGPLSPYGVSKLCSEHYLYCFARVHGLPYVALRYANVYGPRQDPAGEAGVVAIFGRKMLQRETPTIYGDGEQVRDYVYVGDVVRANLLALAKLGQGGQPASPDDWAYNIGTGQETSVNALFAMLAGITGYTGRPVYGPERPGELKKIYLDVTRARRELGWVPQVSLREGLDLTMRAIGGDKPLAGGL
jgi:UDP-glucose 4-epimerase